jgi:hypothetical protein
MQAIAYRFEVRKVSQDAIKTVPIISQGPKGCKISGRLCEQSDEAN